MRKRISVYFRLFNIKFKKHIGLWWLLAICFLLFDLMLFISRFFADKPNEFGDSAGAANGLFSAFAFAGVVYAIFLQKNELELQREELIQTREELKGQKHEFEQQNETLKRQRFENTFFNMLSLQQEIVSGLEYRNQKKEEYALDQFGRPEYKYIEHQKKGREVFSFLYLEEFFMYEKDKRGLYNYLKLHENEFDSLFAIVIFDHYFRHLYRIIKFVDEANFSLEDKYQYTSIVRAQLSPYELLLLFYNCQFGAGVKKFKPLIEKYALFKNLRFKLLAKPEHKTLYNNSAYEKTLPEEN